MAQEQIQEQRQEQKLQQSISSQQFLQAQLVELPITQLMERIETEMHDNPALETSSEEDWPGQNDGLEYDDAPDGSDEQGDYDMQREREERSDALDAALEEIGRDDEDLPVYHNDVRSGGVRDEDYYDGESLSFYDQLVQQMNETELTERERYIMEYLIGSLEDDGLLRKDLESICDELAIYRNFDTTTQEIEAVLTKLQEFDPAGIGARTLQECLLLQIARRDDSKMKKLMAEVIRHYFDEFTKKHWNRIRLALSLDELQAEALQKELRRLNPKPGASMGEVVGHSMQQITPDFIVDTQDDGTVTFTLNSGEMPQLQVSQSFTDLLKDYQQNKDGLTRQMKEALLYTRQKVEAAQSFIDAVRTRRRTLTLTMKAIIQLQHRFFEDGDEASLRPMILKDVAAKTGLDLSTISRVSNSKYVLTRWGMFPLKYFFSDGFVTESGEELSTREIKSNLREIIEAEDKRHPLSDDALSEALKQRGYPVARRTVAKYRDQLGIPIARLRK
ncbi:MAG: RNA polymerase factor sigma-54 [Prevotella sp.]|nr:RNA polymerase factor sigma-54 [Prevotella sp.]